MEKNQAQVKIELRLNKYELLRFKSKIGQDLDFGGETKELIDLRSEIIKDEFEYKDVISNLNYISLNIKPAEEYALHNKNMNRNYFINTGANLFRDWMSVLNDSEVQFVVKRQYHHDIIVSKMIKNQNCYYLDYKLSEHDELPPLTTVGEREKLRKQANIPYTISQPKPKLTSKTPTQGKVLKILTPKHMLQKFPRALSQIKTGKCNAIYRIIYNMHKKLKV